MAKEVWSDYGRVSAFQILWIYYGLLSASRPVIIWNAIAVCINFLTVGVRKEKLAVTSQQLTRRIFAPYQRLDQKSK